MKGRVLLRVLCSFCILIPSINVYSNRIISIGLFSAPPFMYAGRDGRVEGLYVDIVNAVCKKMKVRCRFEMMPYARGHRLLKNGGIDALAGPSKTSERKKYGHYTAEHLGIIQYWGFFVRRRDTNKHKYESYGDLKGHTIGSPRAYYIPPDLKSFLTRHSRIDYIHSEELNFKKLIKGRVDYVYSEINVGRHLAKKIKISDQTVFLQKRVLVKMYPYIVFSKKTVPKNFVNSFSYSLKRFKQGEEFRKILKKYDIRQPKNRVYYDVFLR